MRWLITTYLWKPIGALVLWPNYTEICCWNIVFFSFIIEDFFLDLQQVKLFFYFDFKTLYSEKSSCWQYRCIFIWKKVTIGRKCIFHKKEKEEKKIRRKNVFNGAPSNTIKLFFGKCFIFLFKYLFSTVCKKFTQKCAEIVKQCDYSL